MICLLQITTLNLIKQMILKMINVLKNNNNIKMNKYGNKYTKEIDKSINTLL